MTCKIIGLCQLFLRILSDFLMWKLYKTPDKICFVHSLIHAFSKTQEPLVGQGLLIIEASRLYSVSHSTFSRTPLKEWSVRCRDLYLTRQNTHKIRISMFLEGFEPTMPASERPQTHTIDGATTEMSCLFLSTPNLHNDLEFFSYFFLQNWASKLHVLYNAFALSEGIIFSILHNSLQDQSQLRLITNLLVHFPTNV